MLNSEDDLYKLHQKDSQEQADVWSERQGRKVMPDDLYSWILKREICPYGVISSNTKYWLELMSVCDTEMGLNLPMPYDKLPATFFDVLRIHRDNKPEKIKEGNGKQNN